MIRYTSRGFRYFRKICQTHGSVFPSAMIIALPCAVATAALRHLITQGVIPDLRSPDSVMRDAAAWSGFSFLVGFLVVFRTSQAYQRYWDGCASVYRMGAEWFDACSSLIAFCKIAKASKKDVMTFKSTAACLFSMLHSCALADLEDGNLDKNNRQSFTYEVLGAAVVDHGTLKAVRDSSHKVELLYTWIQKWIVQAIDTGVMAIPAPILARVFAELGRGMIAYHDALEVGEIPFPFPYAQTCDCLLAMHWIVVPFVNSQWATSPAWAAIFSFVQVFIFWSLNFIAVEIENPFGTDANDLEGHAMQQVMNERLLLLVSAYADHIPHVHVENIRELGASQTSVSFRTAWTMVPGSLMSRTGSLRRHAKNAAAAAMASAKGTKAASSYNAEAENDLSEVPKSRWSRITSSGSNASQASSLQQALQPTSDPGVQFEAPRLVSPSAPSLTSEEQGPLERVDEAASFGTVFEALPPGLEPGGQFEASRMATPVPASAPGLAFEKQGPLERVDEAASSGWVFEADALPTSDSPPQRAFAIYDRPWLRSEAPLPPALAPPPLTAKTEAPLPQAPSPPPLPAETEDSCTLTAGRTPTFDGARGNASDADYGALRPSRLGQMNTRFNHAANATGLPPPIPEGEDLLGWRWLGRKGRDTILEQAKAQRRAS